MVRTPVKLALLLGLFSCASPAMADDWPQWLGPQRDSVWREQGIVREIPKDGLPVLWRTPVALGYAGPAVAAGRVFVADYDRRKGEGLSGPMARDRLEGNERILCFNAADGKLLWKHEYDCPYFISYPDGPRCTPTVDGERVYTLGAEGNLLCLAVANGAIIWSKDLKKEYAIEAPYWGFSGHPLVDGDLLYCLVGGKGSVAVAFNKRTGQEVWRALDGPEPGYCPPTMIEAGGVKQLLIWHPEAVNSLDPATGKLYWSIPLKPNFAMSITAPRKLGDFLYASGIGDAAALMKLDPAKPAADVVWRGEPQNAVYCANSTPFLHDGMIYGSDCRSGALMGVRLEDGERLWQTFKPTTGDRRASHGTAFIIRHEDRYFLNSETGDLILSKLSPQGYEELGRFHMLKPDSEAFGRKVVWSHPAFANRCVFARNNSELICVNLAEQGAARQIRQQRKVTLSQATTRISEPVLPDGFPDYVEHLNRRQSAGVTPENNAVVLFWQVVGTKEVNEIPASWREEYFRRLGVPMPPLEGDYLQDAAEYAKSHGAADAVESGQFNTLLDDLYRRPWTEKESPLLVKWLAASEQPLKLAIAMSRRPRHYEPLVCLDPSFRLVGVAIPSTQGSRRVARALTLRAMLRLGQNNVAGAWEDIAAVRRLSRLVNEGPFMVEGLVAIAISGLGVDGEAAIAHYGRLTPAQAAEYRRELEASAPLTGLARRMDEGERLCFLDSMCAVSKHGPFSLVKMINQVDSEVPITSNFDVSNPLFRGLLNFSTDWNATLRTGNLVYDRFVAAIRIENLAARAKAMEAFAKQMQTLAAHAYKWTAIVPLLPLGGDGGRRLAGRHVAGLGLAMMMPAADVALKAESRAVTNDRRTAIAFALAAYRGERGAYPAQLEDLVPKCIEKLPVDAFTGAEFRYERTDDGFRLYSVGPNGKDDGGHGLYDGDDEIKGDDWLLTMPPKPKPKS